MVHGLCPDVLVAVGVVLEILVGEEGGLACHLLAVEAVVVLIEIVHDGSQFIVVIGIRKHKHHAHKPASS